MLAIRSGRSLFHNQPIRILWCVLSCPIDFNLVYDAPNISPSLYSHVYFISSSPEAPWSTQICWLSDLFSWWPGDSTGISMQQNRCNIDTSYRTAMWHRAKRSCGPPYLLPSFMTPLPFVQSPQVWWFHFSYFLCSSFLLSTFFLSLPALLIAESNWLTDLFIHVLYSSNHFDLLVSCSWCVCLLVLWFSG